MVMFAWTFKHALSLIMREITSRNKVETQADVIVVGAGPAGSFAALTAAKAGADVVICEEHEEVGLPSHCPGHISITGLNKLGLHVEGEIVENKIAGAVVYSPLSATFRVDFSSPVTYVVNRAMFDRHLAHLAEKAGAKLLLGTRVKKLRIEDGSACGVYTNKGESLRSKIVIDAEGCALTLLKQMGLQPFDRSLVVSAVNGIVERADHLEEDTVEVYLGHSYAPGFYAWIMPKRDGSAKVGLATRHGNPKEHLTHFLSAHPVARKKIKFSDVKNLSYHLIPLGGPLPITYQNGFLAVGDAASQVKPTTGGGVIMGLTCARIAGETASHAVQCNDPSEDFLSRYQKGWQQEIGFDMAVMRQLRMMLNRLSDKKIDQIIRFCSQFQVDEKLQKLKDIDYQGRAMFELFKSPSVWTIAIYSLLSYLAS